jgi:hypothetical protein
MSYEELFTWRGEIHSRSPLSNHTKFLPRAHVDTSSFAAPGPVGPFGVLCAPRNFPGGNLGVGKHASYSMPVVPRDAAATSVIESGMSPPLQTPCKSDHPLTYLCRDTIACGRLIRRAFAPHELSSLIDEALSKEDGTGSIRHLRADDAQMLIEVIDEVCSEFPCHCMSVETDIRMFCRLDTGNTRAFALGSKELSSTVV